MLREDNGPSINFISHVQPYKRMGCHCYALFGKLQEALQ